MKRAEVRTYIADKKQRGQWDWDGKQEQQRAVYANRQQVNRAYGQRLLRKRGALIERGLAPPALPGARIAQKVGASSALSTVPADTVQETCPRVCPQLT